MLTLLRTVYTNKNELKVEESANKMTFLDMLRPLKKHHSTTPSHVELFLYFSVDPNYS